MMGDVKTYLVSLFGGPDDGTLYRIGLLPGRWVTTNNQTPGDPEDFEENTYLPIDHETAMCKYPDLCDYNHFKWVQAE